MGGSEGRGGEQRVFVDRVRGARPGRRREGVICRHQRSRLGGSEELGAIIWRQLLPPKAIICEGCRGQQLRDLHLLRYRSKVSECAHVLHE